MNTTDAIRELTAWLKLMNYDQHDSTPVEDAVAEGIEALRACQRADVAAFAPPAERTSEPQEAWDYGLTGIQKTMHRGQHLAHCFRGEYPESCKYGNNPCPAKPSAPERPEVEKEDTRDFYERRLREEWESVGGTVRGTMFYHPLLDGFTGDSRTCWKYLLSAVRAEQQEEIARLKAKFDVPEDEHTHAPASFAQLCDTIDSRHLLEQVGNHVGYWYCRAERAEAALKAAQEKA